jgi:hypothetical protein
MDANQSSRSGSSDYQRSKDYRENMRRIKNTAAIELVQRSKQRLARYDVDVYTGLFVVPVGVLKRPLRSVTLGHPVLLGRKERDSYRILVIFGHWSHLLFDSDR